MPSFVLVDPYPFYGIKMVWIDQNKKKLWIDKTSLTVHAVSSLIQQLLIEKLVHPTQNICLFSLMYEGMDGEKRP